jgi:hypothetical protein
MYNSITESCGCHYSMLYVIYAPLVCFTCTVPQSTYIYRAPQCISPRWNWDSPTPLAARECALPPGPKGGGAHSPAAKGVGESQFQRLEKRLALCLLCVQYSLYNIHSSFLGTVICRQSLSILRYCPDGGFLDFSCRCI